MRKVIFTILALYIIFVLSSNMINVKGAASQKTIASKLIRFHVIANSDEDNDQKLKLKVRDKVLEYLAPKLKKCKSVKEARKVLSENNDEVLKIAKSTIVKNGYDYDVKSVLSNENFPVKSYGNITLPQGTYEAYRIIIGESRGHNWWCVMFPPLCFVDITKGDVSYKETEKRMKSVLSEEEYELIDNLEYEKAKENKIEVKFKIVEVVKNLNK
jgi:stage II sporulation protein R